MRDKVLLAGLFAVAVLAWLPTSERSVVLAGGSGPQTSTASMQVFVTVPTTGGITNVNNLDFGTFDNSSPVDGNTTLNVNVSNGTPFNLSLDWGSNFNSDGGGLRTMVQSGGEGPAQPIATAIPYKLYSDLNVTEWGDFGKGGTYPAGNAVFDTGTGVDQTFTIYGQIPLMAVSPAPGFYFDFVTVTLEF